MTDLLWDRAARPDAPLLLLAHGAGAPMDSNFMQLAAAGLAARGVHVARFEFPYMAGRRAGLARRPPDRADTLLACFADTLQRLDHPGPVFIGGKSMGGRMATLLATVQPVTGVVVFGYPFHPPGKPATLRTEHLGALRAPCLICQGERDPFGHRGEVAGYGLPASISLCWLDDGDHDLKPRQRSGRRWQDNLDQAFAHAATWMCSG